MGWYSKPHVCTKWLHTFSLRASNHILQIYVFFFLFFDITLSVSRHDYCIHVRVFCFLTWLHFFFVSRHKFIFCFSSRLHFLMLDMIAFFIARSDYILCLMTCCFFFCFLAILHFLFLDHIAFAVSWHDCICCFQRWLHFCFLTQLHSLTWLHFFLSWHIPNMITFLVFWHDHFLFPERLHILFPSMIIFYVSWHWSNFLFPDMVHVVTIFVHWHGWISISWHPCI